MPRFMGFVRMEEGFGAPPQALMEAMDTYIGEQAAKGVFLDGGGLFGSEDAVNFVVRKGETSRVDGPYAEAKEVVGGFAIMQYDTLEAAICPAARGGPVHPLAMHPPSRFLRVPGRIPGSTSRLPWHPFRGLENHLKPNVEDVAGCST